MSIKLSTSFRIALVALLAGVSQAQTPPPKVADNPAIDPTKAIDKGLAMPTPLDKFLALTLLVQTKEIDWSGTFTAIAVDIDPDQFTDVEVQIPQVLGIRIADGVMAVQAKDAEMLGKAASDIEKLAAKLKVPDGDLARARKARSMANEGKWLDVFRELGFLQQDIMQKLEQNPKDPGSTLLMVGGWLQGSRYTSRLIIDNYSDASSNILREPLLVDALMKKMADLPEAIKKAPSVAKIAADLPKMRKIVDVKIDQAIKKEAVEEVSSLSTSCVKTMLGE
ncbi:hypothetical protein OKA05_08075 [Luteolibacter arcticus]|uniref:Uncharacterized protein n=1 Tax=Luteolibacter arcticus TaxID=1581411 RepID=A0ABT3GFW2_9BACT|nr:hypothetical protein [Luteolibacter arcticus]MCW1922508.1 hypothetical protein [Luteolibacter arcticus]